MFLLIYKAKMVFDSLIRMKMYQISVSSMKKLLLCFQNETAKSATYIINQFRPLFPIGYCLKVKFQMIKNFAIFFEALN
jgi:hypothetical protein